MKPQCTTVLRFLKRRPMTTGAIREKCGVSTVSATIHELRGLGCRIVTELVRVPSRHGGPRCQLRRTAAAAQGCMKPGLSVHYRRARRCHGRKVSVTKWHGHTIRSGHHRLNPRGWRNAADTQMQRVARRIQRVRIAVLVVLLLAAAIHFRPEVPVIVVIAI